MSEDPPIPIPITIINCNVRPAEPLPSFESVHERVLIEYQEVFQQLADA